MCCSVVRAQIQHLLIILWHTKGSLRRQRKYLEESAKDNRGNTEQERYRTGEKVTTSIRKRFPMRQKHLLHAKKMYSILSLRLETKFIHKHPIDATETYLHILSGQAPKLRAAQRNVSFSVHTEGSISFLSIS